MAEGYEYAQGKRKDPYKNYKFRIKWDNKTVAGVSKVSMLKRTTEVVTYRGGGENSVDHKTPGRTTYEGITCERGITYDKEFESWANKVHPYEGDVAMDLDGFRKDLTLEVLNEKGHVALRYYLYGCWISDFTAVPDLEASANAVAIESIKIELEGWVRDSSYEEPNVTSPVPQDI